MRISELARAAAYEDDVLRVSADTYKTWYRNATKRMIEFLGDLELDAAAPAQLARWAQYTERRGIAMVTANSYKRAACAMLRRCGYDELAAVIHIKKEPPLRGKAMSDEHFELILRYANLRDAAILLLLRHSGKRRATICRLRMETTKIWQSPQGDFRLASQSIEKGETPVLVFAKQRAALAVMLWLESRPDPDSPFVFTHLRDGGPLAPNTVTDMFRSLKMKAGIPADVQISPHALRHKFAQDMLEEFDARLVADWMGITVETLLNVYATRTIDAMRRAYFGDE